MRDSAVTVADPFQGITIRTSADVGRHSVLDRLALKLRARGLSVAGFAERMGLTEEERQVLLYTPRFTLRPIQICPRNGWITHLFLGGRGAGKTYSGSSWVVERCMADPDIVLMVAGPTVSEITKNLVEGPSGVLTVAPPWFKPKFFKSKRTLLFPNGAKVFLMAIQKPDKIRSYEVHGIWCDELAAFPANVATESYQQLRDILRQRPTRYMLQHCIGPQLYMTTTPKANALFKRVLADMRASRCAMISRSTSFENAANLAPDAVQQMRALQGTTRGRQEYLGSLVLNETNNAIYRAVDWDKSRVEFNKLPERFDKVIVCVDPATGEKVGAHGADEHGIITVGFKQHDDGFVHAYVLADDSLQTPEPSVWAGRAVSAAKRFEHRTEKVLILGEKTAGGNLVKYTIRSMSKDVRVCTVHARSSKADRAAPVSMLAEAGVVHMAGHFERLEKQLSTFDGTPGGHMRDDRADAFAWPIYWGVVLRGKNRAALAGKDSDALEAEGEDADD